MGFLHSTPLSQNPPFSWHPPSQHPLHGTPPDSTTPWEEWLKHACENITLPQTLFADGKYSSRIDTDTANETVRRWRQRLLSLSWSTLYQSPTVHNHQCLTYLRFLHTERKKSANVREKFILLVSGYTTFIRNISTCFNLWQQYRFTFASISCKQDLIKCFVADVKEFSTSL